MALKMFVRVQRPRTLPYLLEAIYARRSYDQVIIHQGYLSRLPSWVVLPVLSGHAKGLLRCPDELTIVLVHDYRTDPIMPRSLRYVGIHDFVVLEPRLDNGWRNSVKITTLLGYLRSGACRTEYLLYCDSRDAVIRDDPGKALALLKDEKCDLLMSATAFDNGYQYMPEVRAWAERLARPCGSAKQYLNAGVFVGRSEFVLEVLEAAEDYVTEQDLTLEEFARRCREGSLGGKLKQFPRGIGCDQLILRYLHPRFYPRMKVDYGVRLALR